MISLSSTLKYKMSRSSIHELLESKKSNTYMVLPLSTRLCDRVGGVYTSYPDLKISIKLIIVWCSPLLYALHEFYFLLYQPNNSLITHHEV